MHIDLIEVSVESLNARKLNSLKNKFLESFQIKKYLNLFKNNVCILYPKFNSKILIYTYKNKSCSPVFTKL